MSLKRTTILSITAALFFAASAASADEPGTVAVETQQGDKEPEVIIHKIVPRDTLWDISEHYLKDPFKWPGVWKLNPYIVNPHLIYPGNTVRLTPNGIEILEPDDLKAEGLERFSLEPGEQVQVLEPGPEEPVAETPAPKGPSLSDSSIAKSGFITEAELAASGAIVKAKEGKLLVSADDEVFVSFKDNSDVKDGASYTIYTVGRKIEHPDTGRAIGFEVSLLGKLTVTSVNGAVEALVDSSFREIPIGARVRPYSEPVREVEITRADSEVSGVIVTGTEGKENLAAGDIAFVDKGSADGLRKGNVLRVYRPVADVADPMRGGRDMALPPLELGTLVVLETGDSTSTAIVVKGVKPMNWGDKVSTTQAY